MKKSVIITSILLCSMASCQTEHKLRRLVSRVYSVDDALKLNEKYSKWDIVIHELDSVAFFNHGLFARLNSGSLTKIGSKQNGEGNLYKLLLPSSKKNNSSYFVLQIYLK